MADNEVSEYFKRVKPFSKQMYEAEEIRLMSEAMCGNKEAWDRVICSLLNWVIYKATCAKKYYKTVPLDVLISAGNEALVYAMYKFDSSRGTRYMTYATWWIKAFMDRAAKDYKKKPIRIDYCPDDSFPSPEEIEVACEREVENQYNLCEALKILTDKERYVIKSRYLTDKPVSLKKLGIELELSPPRILQIEQEALAKMREHLTSLVEIVGE